MDQHDHVDRRFLLGGLTGVAGMAALAAMSRSAAAGPINPPAGPVLPTGRTLDEIYDRLPAGGAGDGRTAIPGGAVTLVIAQSGSYVLTGPRSVATGDGIVITAPNVTLDLGGFTVSSSANSGNGIEIAAVSGVKVHNGRVRFFLSGVALLGASESVLLEDLEVLSPKLFGVQVVSSAANGVVMRRLSVFDTGATTTAADGNVAITGIVSGGQNASVIDCTVARQRYNGSGTPTFRGIQINGGNSAVVRGCSAISEVLRAAPSQGMSFASPAAIYKDNLVVNFTTKYAGGTDAGGNG